MGDDLNAARDFMSICQNRVQILLGGSPISPAGAIAALGDIKSGAVKMKARGIARLAQYAIDDLTQNSAAETCAQSVHAMTRLIRQYGRGLDEINAAQAEIDAKAEAKLTILENKDSGHYDQDDKAVAAAAKAASALQSVMHLATDDERAPLGQLLAFTRKDEPQPAASPREHHGHNFETIMPDITSEILRIARQQNKSISVSFAADALPIDAGILARLERGLMGLSSRLVTRTIETPKAREGRNLSKSAHIAFTAQGNGGLLDVYISTDGHSPGDITEDEYLADLIKLGARANMTVDGMSVRLKILGLPCSKAHDQDGAPDRAEMNTEDEKIAS